MQFALLPVQSPGEAALEHQHRLSIGFPLRLDPRRRPAADVCAIIAPQHRHVDRRRSGEGAVAQRGERHRFFGDDMGVEQLRESDPFAVEHRVERFDTLLHRDRETVHDLPQCVVIVMQVSAHAPVVRLLGRPRLAG